MKEWYRLFLRGKSVYDAFDHTPKTFQSLKTKDEAEAERLLVALNEAGKQPAMNLSLPGFKGVLNFVVTLTIHKDVRAYPLPLYGKCDQAGRALHCRRHQTRPNRRSARNHPHSRCPTSGGVSQPPRHPSGDFLCSRTPPPIPVGRPCHGLDPFHDPKGSSPTTSTPGPTSRIQQRLKRRL